MEYISHEDYKKMMESFSKGAPKQSLNESVEGSKIVKKPAAHLKAGDVLTSGATVVRGAQSGARTPSGKVDLVVRYPNGKENVVVWGKTTMIGVHTQAEPSKDLEKEGNAFTAGLAKAKKGEEFKVGDKTFKDKTNYDAPIKEADGEAKILGHVKNDIYKVQTPTGEVIDIDFDLEKGDQVDDYGWEGTLVGYDDEYEYILPVALVPMGGGAWDVNPYYKEFSAHPWKKKVDEYQFDQMYPDDPGPFEGKDVDGMIKEFLLKEDDVNWDRMDDEEAEEDETDNGIEEDVEEGLNPAPFQATGPTIQTVEEKKNKFAHLTVEERDQLRQYVETIKTIKEQIKKMTNKSEMEEGGDMTNLVMKPTTMSEEGTVDAHEEIESKIDPKLHDTFHKVLSMVTKQLLNAGIEESHVQEFLKHEVSEMPDFVNRMYEKK